MKPPAGDILITGAGPIGMTLALALLQSACQWRISLIERRPESACSSDARVLAMADASRQLLARINAWPAQTTPINDIHTSQRGGFGRTLMRAAEYDLTALGYVLRHKALVDTLKARIENALRRSHKPLSVSYGCSLAAVDGCSATIHMRDEKSGSEHEINMRPQIIVHADGTPADGERVVSHDYRQQAVIAEVRTSKAHANRAWERFTPDGPLALLPLEEGYAVVFTLPANKAQEVMQMEDEAFLATLQARFGGRHEFVSCGARQCFPLALRMRRKLVHGREIWIGNSAQTLHPVCGQGFNLGLRDAWQLAELILDVSNSSNLANVPQRYAATRRLDRWGGALFTDSIVRLFSNNCVSLSVLRGLGLLSLDLLPPTRHFAARRMIWGARAWP